MELPSHPEAGDGRSHEPQKRTEWGAVMVVVAVLIVVLALLHLTGVVGPAGH